MCRQRNLFFFNYWDFTSPLPLLRQHSRPKNGHKTLAALALNNLSSVSIMWPRPLLPHIYKILILLLLLCHVCGCGMENLIMKPMFVALSHMSDSCFYWSLSPACQLPLSGISLCWNERFHNPFRNLLFRAFLCFIMALWVDLLIFSCPSEENRSRVFNGWKVWCYFLKSTPLTYLTFGLLFQPCKYLSDGVAVRPHLALRRPPASFCQTSFSTRGGGKET